ncbi:helix-turn-helix domain-containing protein [Actinokineospora sp. G85]|uniref:helix-turn-helix domain-containing protein n=1 Tax=Actinokineospora sp. G85 TaxID=3406626 RepID=UPI003C70A81A
MTVDRRIGQHIKALRMRRGLTMTVAAGLAGITQSYWSMIENSRRPVNSRELLERIAKALRVSSLEITGKPFDSVDPASRSILAMMADLGDVLTGWRIGENPGPEAARPWGQLSAELGVLNGRLRPDAEYEAQAEMLPDLIRGLLVATDTADRSAALMGLISAYKASAYLAHDLGVAGLPTLAAERINQVAEATGDDGWVAYATYQRAQLLSGTNRQRQLELALTVADTSQARAETRGLAHLTAALACAVNGDADQARTHMAEATALAQGIGPDVSPWMQTNFGRENVKIWSVTIGLELGEGLRAVEHIGGWQPRAVSKSRQATYWLDVSRALASERKHYARGIRTLELAEALTPQKIHTNMFAREIVALAPGNVRAGAEGDIVRRLSYRMGINPSR